MNFKTRNFFALPCLAAVMALTTIAHADTITGYVFNTASFPAGLSPSTPSTASALGSFSITNNILNFFAPNASTNYTVGTYLTSQGSTVSGLSSGVASLGLNDKELDFYGNVYLRSGVIYNMNHDDGAILFLNNTKVVDSGAPTATFDSTFSVAVGGEYSFLLRYAEVNGAPATLNMDTPFSAPVPEPGTLMMLGTGILGLAGAVRRKLGA